MRLFGFAPAAAITLAAVIAVLSLSGSRTHAQAGETSIGIDADTGGNSATTLGSLDECVEISQGENHEVDIFVRDVTNLIAWDAVLTFEPGVLEIVEVEADLFMAANEGSDVHNISGDLPDDDGRYQVAVFDAADPPAPDSGSGVVARVTVRGTGAGLSELALPLRDLDGNGDPDEGPLLRAEDPDNPADVTIIGDNNGDTLFDGPVAAARIAVDASCTDAPPTTPGPSDDASPEESDDNIDALTIIVVVAGSLAAVAAGGVAAAWAVRRRRGAGG